MTREEFVRMVEESDIRRGKIADSKNIEYTRGGNEDHLINFKNIGRELDIDPLKVLLVYFMKHKDSLLSYAKHRREFSDEGIQGRIDDMQNYLDLARGLIIDGKK